MRKSSSKRTSRAVENRRETVGGYAKKDGLVPDLADSSRASIMGAWWGTPDLRDHHWDGQPVPGMVCGDRGTLGWAVRDDLEREPQEEERRVQRNERGIIQVLPELIWYGGVMLSVLVMRLLGVS